MGKKRKGKGGKKGRGKAGAGSLMEGEKVIWIRVSVRMNMMVQARTRQSLKVSLWSYFKDLRYWGVLIAHEITKVLFSQH